MVKVNNGQDVLDSGDVIEIIDVLREALWIPSELREYVGWDKKEEKEG